MNNILITQKSEFIESRNEFRDSLDQQFAVNFSEEFNLIPVPNAVKNPKKFAKSLGTRGVILSGGSSIGSYQKTSDLIRFSLEQDLLEYAVENNLPVIGICYGMQRLNVFEGGGISLIANHVNSNHGVYFEKIQLEVNSYHENGIFEKDLSESFLPLGKCLDGSIECIVHKKLPWLGIMWHPERECSSKQLWLDVIKMILGANKIKNSEALVNLIRTNINN